MSEDENSHLLNEIKDSLWHLLPIGIFTLLIDIHLFFDDYIEILQSARGKGIILLILIIGIFVDYFKARKKLNRLIHKSVWKE